jgi:radical SAM protein with 4Fe4S-binding SPASM domain
MEDMRVRYESFGGIIALDNPAATVYVDQEYMQGLGYADSPLWNRESPCLSAPVTAHFALTNRCPLSCRTCYNAAGALSSPELTTEEAKQVLDTLAAMRVFTVAFGGGEPLARDDIFELAEHARQRGIVPTLTTNGFYIDRRIARRCRVFSHIHVSLDGVGKTYQAVRGVDGFEHAARALKLLTRTGISVGVNCVVSRANFDHLEDLVRFITSLGVRDVIFLRLKPAGRAQSVYESLRLTPQQRMQFYPYLKTLTHRYKLLCHCDCAMMPFVYCHHPDEEALRLFAGEGCVGANEIIEILPHGGVKACSFAAETTGRADDLPHLWSTDYAFERFRCWTRSAPEPCRTCRYLELCRGGCHAVAEALTGLFNAPDPECPFVEERKT